MTEVKARCEIPVAYRDLFAPHRYKLYPHGRGSGSSWSFARALLMQVAERGKRVLCTREYQASIGDSVHRVLTDQINMLGMQELFRPVQSEIRCVNGGLFLFKGIRSSPDEIKELEGIDIAWVAEAQRASQESLDLLVPTIRKPGSEIWQEWNPDDPKAPAQRMVEDPPPDTVVRHCTWRDNPFLPDVLHAEMEYCRRTDPDKFRWIWEGRPRKLSHALVFSGKYRIEEFSHPTDDIDRYYYGADWGFAEDPTTMVRSYIMGRTLYIDYEVYGIGVEINELPQFFRAIPGSAEWPSVADSQRPDTISYLRNHGYPHMRGAYKPKGSVEEGVEQLRDFEEIVIHPRCKHTADEFGSYSYKVDKTTGDVLPIIVDKDNHIIDALRYSHFKRHKRQVRVL